MNTIIISISTLLNIALLIAFWRRHIIPRNTKNKMQALVNTLKIRITELDSEVSRQAYIINDYKSKLQFTNQSTEKRSISTFAPEANTEKMQDILGDKQMLEKEKEAFKLKNQKLWEQSLAVYKEKERIDAIRKYIESQHTNLTHSINYALRIQEALLPSNELLKQIFPSHFILYRPRDIVSGDFYWIKQIKNRTVFIAADCTGHGVPGAFMSLLGISFLNEIASTETELSAAQILEEMRYKIKAVFQKDDGNITIQDGMDMATCIVNHETKELEFSGANNGIFIAKNNGSLMEIKGTRNPISHYRKEIPFVNHLIQLETNDSIFMYSDGYFDQFGGNNKQKITKSRFASILKECKHKNIPMSGYKKELELFLDDWQDNEIQIDDILVFGVTCFPQE